MKPDEQWKNMEEYEDCDLSALINMPTISKLPSINPLEKIKRNLIANAIWAFIIVASYIFILIKFPLWQVRLCIGTVLAFTLGAIYSNYVLYRNIDNKVVSNTVLQEMERQYKSIRHWMKNQENMGLFVYPVSAAGGFMLGGYLGSGKSIEVFMGNSRNIIILIVVIAIMVPLCFKLAKWMNKKAFGQYADQLKQNIDALKSGH